MQMPSLNQVKRLCKLQKRQIIQGQIALHVGRYIVTMMGTGVILLTGFQLSGGDGQMNDLIWYSWLGGIIIGTMIGSNMVLDEVSRAGPRNVVITGRFSYGHIIHCDLQQSDMVVLLMLIISDALQFYLVACPMYIANPTLCAQGRSSRKILGFVPVLSSYFSTLSNFLQVPGDDNTSQGIVDICRGIGGTTSIKFYCPLTKNG